MSILLQPKDARSEIVYRRTYSRPRSDGTQETWHETVDRVCDHHRWLWERAQGKALASHQGLELDVLGRILRDKLGMVSGRTLWLGGTDISKRREASQFNCSYLHVETVHDLVDVFWLLLQGCGVGFQPVTGTLSGFTKPVLVEVRRSQRTSKGGNPNNQETWSGDTWRLLIGDSAEAWAKAIGKLVAMKYPVARIVLDFAEVRPAGERLSGYGWICSGDAQIASAFKRIALILSRRSGRLLRRMDILDIVNHLGTTLSSRRSAQIALMPYGDEETDDFVTAKRDFWLHDNHHRQQSNNSLLFHEQPSRCELASLFEAIVENGGSEPGIINAQEARRRAPWFAGVNPCAEILLGNRGFCNLVDLNLAQFGDDYEEMLRTAHLLGRANYRQTCVDLRDGILQDAWHQQQQFLRLCGGGITGIAQRTDLSEYDLRRIKYAYTTGAYSMAYELNMPLPKMTTTIKPSGTVSKLMGCTEGVHRPLGRYIFNHIQFGIHDPLLKAIKEAGYMTMPHPTDASSVLVRFPVEWSNVPFEKIGDKQVNIESAVDQLERYRTMMRNYVDHNCSVTVSWSVEEAPGIVDWLTDHWNDYVGVSFLFRADPTKSALDLGYPYLPQEVVSEERYHDYLSTLGPIEVPDTNDVDHAIDDCETGACPVR